MGLMLYGRLGRRGVYETQAMLRSLMGGAVIQPEKGDKRFRDPLWTSNPGYRTLMQSYLAWSSGVAAWVDGLVYAAVAVTVVSGVTFFSSSPLIGLSPAGPAIAP